MIIHKFTKQKSNSIPQENINGKAFLDVGESQMLKYLLHKGASKYMASKEWWALLSKSVVGSGTVTAGLSAFPELYAQVSVRDTQNIRRWLLRNH